MSQSVSWSSEKQPPARGPMTHFWRVRKTLPWRVGHQCRILARAAGPGPRSICVEFADGARVITHRHAVRRLAGGEDASQLSEPAT